jgi:hypothetical protein
MEEQELMVGVEFEGGRPSYIREGFEFGTLTPDQAINFMVKSGLTGYEFIESDFVTVVPNAEINVAVRIHGESYKENSALLGAKETPTLDQPNVYNPQRLRRREHNAYLRVRRITAHRSFNYADFMGSWRSGRILDRGMYEKWKSRGISSYFYNVALLYPIRAQVGNLCVNGDYNSPNRVVSQLDGAYKLLAFEAEKQVKHRIVYAIPELIAGQHLHILASGKTIKVPFSGDWADLTAQLEAIKTQINDVKWNNRATGTEVPLFQAEVVDIETEKFLKVESTEHRQNVEFKIGITNKATINWKTVRGTELFGNVTIKEEKQGNLYQEPISIDYLKMYELSQMTRDARYKKLMDWFIDYSEQLYFYDDIEGLSRNDVVTYVSPTMTRALARAALLLQNNYSGSAKAFKEALGMNLRQHPKLIGSETFTAERGNLHVGVDQLSDITRVSSNYDWGKEEIQTKVDGALGFQWLYPHETVTNSMHVKDSFQPLDDFKNQYADASRIPMSAYKNILG